MAITKQERDGAHPASHYLVVEDAEHPTTWHLRYKNVGGDIDHALAGAAWAALHQGFQGNVYEGPGKRQAIAKLKQIYETAGWDLPNASKAVSVALDGGEALPLMVRSPQALIVPRKSDGEWVLEVLGAPYGGPAYGNKDLQGQYFSERTNFMLNIGDERPVIYYHGDGPNGLPEMRVDVIGTAKAIRRDSQGLWFRVILDKTKRYAARVFDAARKGVAKASTGTVDYLIRWTADGELLQWPVAELSLLDAIGGRIPANPFATVSVKAMYDEAGLAVPEAFAQDAGDASKALAEHGYEGESASEDDLAEALIILAGLYEQANKE